jgi:hypothetical protein
MVQVVLRAMMWMPAVERDLRRGQAAGEPKVAPPHDDRTLF